MTQIVMREFLQAPGIIVIKCDQLLVSFKRGTTLLGHAALEQELKALSGVKVDVVSERGLREDSGSGTE